MNSTSAAVEIRDSRTWELLESQANFKEDESAWIDNRANELMNKFSGGADENIIKGINFLLGGSSDGEIYNQFITDICYSQAEYECKKLGVL